MANKPTKKIDERVKKVLQEQGFDWKECLWDCHGTWVMYHKYIEIAAAQNKITYDLHEVEFDTKNKIAVVKCVATLKDQTVSTYGEAAPGNCKNVYTAAMAEKRAVDRAVLKLLGLHGFIYSEDEIDRDPPPPAEPKLKAVPDLSIAEHIDVLKNLATKDLRLKYWYKLHPNVRTAIRKETDEFAS